MNLKQLINNHGKNEKSIDYIKTIVNDYGNGFLDKTNNIWFWFLELGAKNYEEKFREQLDILDKDSIIEVYLDLENAKRKKIIIREDQDSFEQNNKVIRGKRNIYDGEKRYDDVRSEFFSLCLNYNQEFAIQTILKEEENRALEVIKEKEKDLAQLEELFHLEAISEEWYTHSKGRILRRR